MLNIFFYRHHTKIHTIMSFIKIKATVFGQVTILSAGKGKESLLLLI